MGNSVISTFIIIIVCILLIGLWVLLQIKGNFNKVMVCIFIIFVVFMIILIGGNPFTACIFGIIYVGAMSILFIVFLSYTGSEVEKSTEVMSSNSWVSFFCLIIVIHTPLIKGVFKEISINAQANRIKKPEMPEFFYHLYISYSAFFVIMLLALLIGLVAVLTIVGVSRWSKNKKLK